MAPFRRIGIDGPAVSWENDRQVTEMLADCVGEFAGEVSLTAEDATGSAQRPSEGTTEHCHRPPRRPVTCQATSQHVQVDVGSNANGAPDKRFAANREDWRGSQGSVSGNRRRLRL